MDSRFFFPRRAEFRDIVALNVEDGRRRVVSPGSYATWSPDGNRIAVVGPVDDNGGHLATVAPDGSDRRIIVRAKDNGDLDLVK